MQDIEKPHAVLPVEAAEQCAKGIAEPLVEALREEEVPALGSTVGEAQGRRLNADDLASMPRRLALGSMPRWDTADLIADIMLGRLVAPVGAGECELAVYTRDFDDDD